MAPEPMPMQDQDPDVTAAREAHAEYLTAAQEARSSYRLSDPARAEAVDAAYTAYLEALQGAWDRLQARRRKRLEWLETQVPTGPGIPAYTSPADRAVLMAAFRAAYDKATDTDRMGRIRLLQEAERFDDDAARRGALTAIVDFSEMHTIRDWVNEHLTTARYLDEVASLREAIAGRSTRPDHRLAVQAMRPVRAPDEVRQPPQLQRLREAAEAQRQALSQSRARSRF
ncbi:hypothetical protein [Streptomyces marianii]|uniref:Uncharacterized protein n=1 Tax=Streptomyces marianii TaxID=1817406 RepID=A0A5R9E524_9ACTN|nr:hypothetical protein [Streptomyces marianii]TLQ45058.1 hypothetical protein FEF34_20185 [Streptomyces marianii]